MRQIHIDPQLDLDQGVYKICRGANLLWQQPGAEAYRFADILDRVAQSPISTVKQNIWVATVINPGLALIVFRTT